MSSETQDIFDLKCLIKNINIELCARIENGLKQLLALVTSNGDLVLHYSFGELPEVVRRIPWYSSKHKCIQALCFDPTATWLLVICADGSLHIIPFLSLVDKTQKIDCKWSVTDSTIFCKPPQSPDCKPTAIVWWQTLDSNQNGLIGYENGTVALISLTDGRCLATCTIKEAITQLTLCGDKSLDTIFLLINGSSGQQWKHILEQHSVGYVWPPELTNHTDDSTRSRLLSLRQMGFDKLVSLRQRLLEGRHFKKDNSETSSEISISLDAAQNGPELLPHLPDTYFSPQYAKNRYLFSAFYKPASLLTVHAVDVDAAPLYSHKLPPRTDDVLLTDQFIFTLNSSRNMVTLVSNHLSECRLDGETEFNENSVVAKFTFDNEVVLKLFKLVDFDSTKNKSKDEEKEKLFEMPKTVDDLDIPKAEIDTCILITNKAVYKIIIRISPIHKFVHHILGGADFDAVEKLVDVFGLNLQQLLECCGDLLISQGSIHLGILLYRQAKVHLLKRVLKLAIAADCKTLLKFLHSCLSASKVDMSVATKIHIGNLAVMAYTELILRHTGQARVSNTKDFMNFLKYEEFFDQILAVNVACQAGHWKILSLLAKSRGLQPEVVSALGQILQTARAPRPTDLEFIHTLSEPCLMQSLLLSPKGAEIILRYIRKHVAVFPTNILRRFLTQLDPSQPCAISFFGIKSRLPKSSLSLSSTDSADYENDGNSTIIKNFIETFIILLVYLISKTDTNNYNLSYLEKIKCPPELVQEPQLNKFPDVRPLSCGYEHAALVRNDQAFTMGVSGSGCLGLGPILSQSSSPKLVETLADLKVKVISVSCGRKHTLFLTDCGVYTSGSNKYGQLGLGSYVQESPYPQIINNLSYVKVVEIVCGQYHSLALTADGQVYTWGWGIHGQLGHGTCGNKFQPKLLNFNQKVKQVTAGHAHSLILTIKGELFGFGSNAFGQLESSHEESNKFSKPIRIHIMPNILSPVEKVTSKYFHNVAVLQDQEVYTWGASPQEVRIFQAKNNQKVNGVSVKLSDSWKSSVKIYSGGTGTLIEEISIGYKHTAILHNGKILWGKNKDDDLNSPDLRDQDTLNIINHRFLHISCGLDYTMAIDHIGRLLVWASVSIAQTILGRIFDDDKKADNKILVSKNTRRVLRYPVNTQGNSQHFPIEVPGLPSMAITFKPTDHQLLFTRSFIPYSILKIENNIVWPCNQNSKENGSCLNDSEEYPEYNFGQKTLHYILETFYSLYDCDIIQQICLSVQNHQAASKVALLGEHYCDSLSFQLKAFKKFMNLFEKSFQIFWEDYKSFRQAKKQENYFDLIKNATMYTDISTHSNSLEQLNSHTPAQILSASSSLDSMRIWDDQEHQGGCESPCEVSEIEDIRNNMSQFVQSLKNNQITSPITSVSKLVSETDKANVTANSEFEIQDRDIKNIIEMASTIIEFYIQKIYSSENHILMQNILMQIIEFWLSNNLPTPILEGVLIKNMDKYFYPLSILLFCKDFSSDSDDQISSGRFIQKNSARFLKEFSTKFCLQLCLMVVENVNKT